MKKSTKVKIALFYRYLTRISLLQGFVLFVKFHLLNIQWGVKVPMLRHPIFLRKDTSDLTTFDQIFLTGIYKLPDGFEPKVIVDCGANVGMATLYFANRFPSAKIVAIEPEQSNFEMLQINCNGYQNISLIKKAVWHSTGHLYIVDSGKGNYAYSVKTYLDEGDKSISSIEAITLTDVMEEYKLGSIDFLKIDIEGAEKFVFSENYDPWLARTKILSIELHEGLNPGTSRAIIKALAKHDFSVRGSFEGLFCFK